jgi:hypothetical protein
MSFHKARNIKYAEEHNYEDIYTIWNALENKPQCFEVPVN